MSKLILQIYGAPEEALKALVETIAAEDVKNAAKALGILNSASGKPVDQSSRFDNALAIKSLEQAVIDEATKESGAAGTPPGAGTDAGTPPEPGTDGDEGPSVTGAVEPTDDEDEDEAEDDGSLDFQRAVVLDLREQLKEATYELGVRQEVKAATEKVPTQHELIQMKKKRDAELAELAAEEDAE